MRQHFTKARPVTRTEAGLGHSQAVAGLVCSQCQLPPPTTRRPGGRQKECPGPEARAVCLGSCLQPSPTSRATGNPAGAGRGGLGKGETEGFILPQTHRGTRRHLSGRAPRLRAPGLLGDPGSGVFTRPALSFHDGGDNMPHFRSSHPSRPPNLWSCSAVSVTRSQPPSENIKWEFSEINYS